jgi:hypothetical protein
MTKMNQILLLSLLLVISASSFAAAEKASATKAIATNDKTVVPAPIPTADEVRCERLAGVSISEFKATLVENCNLSKPFSSSLSRLLNEDNYFYCCQKR